MGLDIQAENQITAKEVQKFSPEWLRSRSTLEIEAHLDATPILNSLNEQLGTKMQQRPDGFHITIIGPAENEFIKSLTEDELNELQSISEAIQRGEGISTMGIGYIDGATMPGMRESDKAKKTSFIALDIPSLNEFREKHGLKRKDFHVTLGFEGGDIHMQIIGTEQGPKGKQKDVLAPVPKKADPSFSEYLDSTALSYGEIDGQEKQKSVEKPKTEITPETPKEYNEDQLLENLHIYEKEGKTPSGSAAEITQMILSGNVKGLGRTYGKQMASIRAAMIASEKK
ncbi:hypothetical protein KBC54_02365 [Patescibacteria group bacterium]|nr:hypothetical protein [Patescibacteria group bacterium]